MILDQFRLDERVALVTGASRGLGQAMAVALAEAGADVALLGYRTPLDETMRRVLEAGRRGLSIEADLSGIESVDGILKQVIDRFGRIDILVNNAGVTRTREALDFSIEAWDEVIALNLRTVFFLSQAVAREMIKTGGGKIIHIASMTSFEGGALIPSYAASKGGVAAMTRSLADEWAGKGIHVNAIAPGWMATEMTEGLWKDPVRNAKLMERIPAGRWGRGEDLMGAVVFLASAASDYVNGHILCVDGGYLAR